MFDADTDSTFYLFLDFWCRCRQYFFDDFGSSMNLPVALFDIFCGFSDLRCRYRQYFLPIFGSLMQIPTSLFDLFDGLSYFLCRHRQHFLPLFGSLVYIPGVLFTHVRLFWWNLEFCMQIPTTLFTYFFAVWCRYRHHFLPVFDSSMNPPVALSYPFDWFSVFWCRYRHHFLPTSVTHVHLTTVLVHTIVYNRVRTRCTCTIRCSYSTGTVR